MSPQSRGCSQSSDVWAVTAEVLDVSRDRGVIPTLAHIRWSRDGQGLLCLSELLTHRIVKDNESCLKSPSLGIVCFTAINNWNKKWYPNVVCCCSEKCRTRSTGFAKGWWQGPKRPTQDWSGGWMSGENWLLEAGACETDGIHIRTVSQTVALVTWKTECVICLWIW